MPKQKRTSNAGDNPFRQGFDARMANRPIFTNPYPNDSPARQEWSNGFAAASKHTDQPKGSPKMEVISEGPCTIVTKSFLPELPRDVDGDPIEATPATAPDPPRDSEKGGITWPKKK